jgi:hypothetical protein
MLFWGRSKFIDFGLEKAVFDALFEVC